MAESGDLSSSVHGFLFTVTNKLPNESWPDLKKKKNELQALKVPRKKNFKKILCNCSIFGKVLGSLR